MIRRLVVAVALLIGVTAPASSQDTGWEILRFDVVYTLNTNRTIDVMERIEVDFGQLQKHGIYRDIRTKYRRMSEGRVNVPAGTVSVDIDNINVTNDQGRALTIDVSRGTDTRIKVGDADIIVTGRQVYVIRYQLESGVGFFPEFDEFYWQVTGTAWPVPIREATARVVLPEHTAGDSTRYRAWCYSGWDESSTSDKCTREVASQTEFRFSASQLDPLEGLTLVAAFPKGIIPEPTQAEKTAKQVGIWWPVAVPLLMLVGMGRLWQVKGREPKSSSIVPNWRAPEQLPPGAAGTLLDQKADMDDIVATILDLAVRGFITIREVPPEGILSGVGEGSFLGKALKKLGLNEHDWEITRTGKVTEGLSKYEKLVLEGVLEGDDTRLMSDLHNDFYKHIPKIHKAMYADVVERGLFKERPEKVRAKYLVIGIIVMITAPILAMAMQNLVMAAAFVISGLIIIAFASAMPAMTASGAKQWAELKGLEEYIRRAEKAELEGRQAPEKTTHLFETLLPYAVALDVSNIWVKQFDSVLSSSPPTWYVGSNPAHFSGSHFQSSLSGFHSAATKTLGSSPGSSSGSGGGGSVGGGGGGGGGGSW